MSEIQNITSKIWSMANELRGSMDASEYKNYIFAFMFYRYLSEHQEDYALTYELFDIENGQSVNDAYKVAVAEDGLEDYLEAISEDLGYAIAPEDTWASLLERVHNNEVIPSDYQTIFDHFNENAKRNQAANRDFEGLFSDVNLGDSRLGNSTNARAKSLNNIVKLVDDISYKNESGKDILGEIYEFLIGQFAQSAGKKGGEFYTPHQVSQILAKLVTSGASAKESTFTVYDPTMGSGSLLLTVRNELDGGNRDGAIKFYGQEKNTTTYNLGRMNLMMHGVSYKNMDTHNADTLGPDWPDGVDRDGIDRPRSFDAVVANPPYSAKWDNDTTKLKDPRFKEYGKLAPASKADYAFILHSIYHLNQTGKMAIVLPHGVLFRGAAEGVIRKALIEKNYLDGIIGLPANLFYGTSIPTTILVFSKNRKATDVFFIDASKEFNKGKNQNTLSDEHIEKIITTYNNREDVDKYAHLASLDEIIENNYNLNIPRYVDTFEEEEPIDIEQVMADIAKDNQEILELEKTIEAQLKQLGIDLHF